MNSKDLDLIQARICYCFKNSELLVAAFTHSSFVNEHKTVGNERIEFLGDCVLNFLVGERLFKLDPTASEGKLSSRRSALVSRAPLARIVDGLGLIEYLQVGAGVNKSAFSDKARSDLFEAIVGAVYIDGGIEACRKLLDSIFYDTVEPERDYKSELQEFAVARAVAVVYTVEPFDGNFRATVNVGGVKYSGIGKSKHGAEIAVAKIALEALLK